MKNIYYFIIILAVLSTACTKLDLTDMDEMGYQTSLAVPICRYQANILDILASQNDTNGYIGFGEDGKTIYISWEQDMGAEDLSFIDFSNGEPFGDVIKLKKIPGLTYLASATEPVNIEGTISYSDTVVYEFGFDSVTTEVEYLIDTMMFTGGEIEMNINTTDITLDDNNYIVMKYSFPELQQCKTKTFCDTLKSASSSFKHKLSSFIADFTEHEGYENGVKMIVGVTLVSNGNMTATKNAEIQYIVQIKKLGYDEAHGRLWNANPVYENVVRMQIPPDLYKLDLFQDNKLLFHNPVLELNLMHNLGVDFRYEIDTMYSLDHNAVKHYADFHGSKSYTHEAKSPDVPHEYVSDNITFDRESAATNRLFEDIPDSIIVKYNVYVGKKNGKHGDFLVDPVEMTIDIKAIADMCFDAATNFVRNDTMAADLVSVDTTFMEYAEIDTFFVYLTAHNHIPTQLAINIAFLDSLGRPLYVVEGVGIECPEINSDGTVKETKDQTVAPIIFVERDIENIMKTKSIKFTAVLKTKDAESMTNIKADDSLTVDVTAFAKVKAKLNKLFNN